MDSMHESADDITMESIDDIEQVDQAMQDKKQEKKEGTSYSFFPKSGTAAGPGTTGRASSYSMSFSAVTGEDVREAVESWRDGLEGDWSLGDTKCQI